MAAQGEAPRNVGGAAPRATRRSVTREGQLRRPLLPELRQVPVALVLGAEERAARAGVVGVVIVLLVVRPVRQARIECRPGVGLNELA